MTKPLKQFDFGQNWQEFSSNALTTDRVREAQQEFQQLISPLDLIGRSFLDIGFGQGLGLLAAASLGARAVGCDINPKCARVLEFNHRHFPQLAKLPAAIAVIPRNPGHL